MGCRWCGSAVARDDQHRSGTLPGGALLRQGLVDLADQWHRLCSGAVPRQGRRRRRVQPGSSPRPEALGPRSPSTVWPSSTRRRVRPTACQPNVSLVGGTPSGPRHHHFCRRQHRLHRRQLLQRRWRFGWARGCTRRADLHRQLGVQAEWHLRHRPGIGGEGQHPLHRWGLPGSGRCSSAFGSPPSTPPLVRCCRGLPTLTPPGRAGHRGVTGRNEGRDRWRLLQRQRCLLPLDRGGPRSRRDEPGGEPADVPRGLHPQQLDDQAHLQRERRALLHLQRGIGRGGLRRSRRVLLGHAGPGSGGTPAWAPPRQRWSTRAPCTPPATPTTAVSEDRTASRTASATT